MTRCYPHFAFWALVISTVAPATALGEDFLGSLASVRAESPQLLVAGCTHVLLNARPPGYALCTSVRRYFEDETVADLRSELDLMARLQLASFVLDDSGDQGSTRFNLRGFQMHQMWWEGDMLVGLYFAPVEGVQRVSQQNHEDEPAAATAAEMILKGRELKKAGELEAARELFSEIRKDFPLTPQARRALREIYFVDTLLKKRRFTIPKDTP